MNLHSYGFFDLLGLISNPLTARPVYMLISKAWSNLKHESATRMLVQIGIPSDRNVEVASERNGFIHKCSSRLLQRVFRW